jgi:hypothetical protein
MIRALMMCLAGFLIGCNSTPSWKVYPNNQRIMVTTGYDEYGPRAIGKDLAFSVILPPDEWSYYSKSDATSMGYLNPYGRKNRKELMIEWRWINRNSAETKETINGDAPYYLPWYSGR